MRYALNLPSLVIALLMALPAAAADPDEISHRVRTQLDRKSEVRLAKFLERSERRITAALQLEDPRYDSIGSGVEATTGSGTLVCVTHACPS